jgi:hypothetical protein
MAGDTDGTTRRSPWDRVWTAFVPRASAVRRSTDRTETIARWVALTLLMLSMPVLLVVGSAHTQQARDSAAAVRAIAHPVDAVVVGMRPEGIDARGERSGRTGLTVQWTEDDGTVRTASDHAYGEVRAGQHRAIWADASGRRVQAPATTAGTIAEGALLVVGLASGEVLLLGVLLWLLRVRLDRHRLRQWDEEWAALARRGNRGVMG